MANYSIEVLSVSGVVRANGADPLRIAECALGGRVLRDLWENPSSPPGSVVLPASWNVRCLDVGAIPIISGTAQFDDDLIYIVQLVDGAQTGVNDLIPTFEAWAAALEIAES